MHPNQARRRYSLVLTEERLRRDSGISDSQCYFDYFVLVYNEQFILVNILMYYRRKIILALIERFGGALKPTNFQKLLFLFTRMQQKPVFEFVPYRYGPFSFQSMADKQTMTAYGLLKNDKQWVYAGDESFIPQLKPTDRQHLEFLWKQFHASSTDYLLQYTYREYPFYATRSEIAERVLDRESLNKVGMHRPGNCDHKLYTIGYEGITAEAYMNKLYLKNIELLLDVRKNSFSMKYGFSKSRLEGMCEKMDIRFMHIPELGIASDKRKKLKTREDYDRLFDEYQTDTLPNRKNQLENVYALFKQYNRVAITCFEKEHTSCHRHKISDYLNSEFGVPVEHL